MKAVEVAAGLIFRGGKLLITQRRPQDHLGGLWEFPGGKREPNETYEQCLERELVEELGIRVTDLKPLVEVTHAYPEKTVHLKFFTGRLMAGEPAALGCSDLCWVQQNELDRYAFPPADAQLLERLKTTDELWRKP